MTNATLVLGLLVLIMWRLYMASARFGSSLLADGGSIGCFVAAVGLGSAALATHDSDPWSTRLAIAQAVNVAACIWLLTRADVVD